MFIRHRRNNQNPSSNSGRSHRVLFRKTKTTEVASYRVTVERVVSSAVNEYYNGNGDDASEDSFGPEFESVDLNPYYGRGEGGEYEGTEVEEANPYYEQSGKNG